MVRRTKSGPEHRPKSGPVKTGPTGLVAPALSGPEHRPKSGPVKTGPTGPVAPALLLVDSIMVDSEMEVTG